jgi:hypothetical protein
MPTEPHMQGRVPAVAPIFLSVAGLFELHASRGSCPGRSNSDGLCLTRFNIEIERKSHPAVGFESSHNEDEVEKL